VDRAIQFPTGSRLRLADLNDDPYPVFELLRNTEPVSWVESADMWLVTRREDVLAVLSDPLTFTTDSAHSTIRIAFGAQMLSVEGDRHARYKRQCFPAFRPEVLETRMRPVLENMANGLIDRLPPRSELRTAFAGPMAIGAISAITGIPRAASSVLEQCYLSLSAALANFTGDPAVREAGVAAASRMRTLLSECLRDAPDDAAWPLLSALKQPSEDALSAEESIANCLVILFGGIETTESAILNALWALLTHPEEAALTARDPALLAGAIEESLRWEAAVQSCTRHASRRASIAGVPVEEGETVQCMIGAANRDPSYFCEPHRFDPRRVNASHHLTFGYGRHFCLGAALARLNLGISLRTLFERLPAMKLIRDVSSPPRGYEFRKPAALWVE
jgi:cytochrome P450